MKIAILITISFWVFLLGPGLCLAGALEHACDDSPLESTCHHEDDCAGDPCTGEILRPDSVVSLLFIVVSAAIADDGLVPAAEGGREVPFRDDLPGPDRTNLPLPADALPLLS